MKRTFFALLFALLLASPVVAAELQLDWDDNDPAEQVDFYTLYQSTDGMNFTALTPTYSVSEATLDLEPGVYYFKVTATNVWNESGFSNVVETPPGASPPANLNLVAIIAAAIAGLLILLFGRRKKTE